MDNFFKYNNKFLESELLYLDSLLKKEGDYNNSINNLIINTEQIGNQLSLEIDNLNNNNNIKDASNLKVEENKNDKNPIDSQENEKK